MSNCRHHWQPLADDKRIWTRCVKCGEEREGRTHEEGLMSTLSYIFSDAFSGSTEDTET